MKYKLTWVCISNEGMEDGTQIGKLITTTTTAWPKWDSEHKGPWWLVVKVEKGLS